MMDFGVFFLLKYLLNVISLKQNKFCKENYDFFFMWKKNEKNISNLRDDAEKEKKDFLLENHLIR